MIAPNGNIAHLGNMGACLGGELSGGPVLIESRHGEPAISRDVGSIVHRDKAVGVARVSNHKDANIGSSRTLNGLPLPRKDLSIDAEQVSALHTCLARDAPDKQGPVGVAETLVEIASGTNIAEKREGTVVQLHDDTLQSLHGRLDLKQVERDRLIRSEEFPRRNAKEKRITDLSGCTSNGYTYRLLGVH